MDSPEISFLVRETSGQIGYISEGLALPEFFSLVRAKEDNKRFLVDFSPVINALHQLHKHSHDEAILLDYNTLYNNWQDAKTYTNERVKFHKNDALAQQSAALVNKLQLSLQKRGSVTTIYSPAVLENVLALRKDSNLYIDAMLCLVYSKAFLDIGSFRLDVVVSSYADFLVNLVDELYRHVLRSGNYENSFLKFVAFEHPTEIDSHLRLDSDLGTESFKLNCLAAARPILGHAELREHEFISIKEVKVCYDAFGPDFVRAGHELRDLLYKARSLKKLVELLTEGDIEWEASEEAVNALAKQIRIEKRPFGLPP